MMSDTLKQLMYKNHFQIYILHNLIISGIEFFQKSGLDNERSN